jgi:ATP-dependent RNA helicase DDX54/DBP10
VDIGAPHSPSISDEDGEDSASDRSFDLSSALTQRRTTLQKSKAPLVSHHDSTNDDTELEDMIRNSISRRNVKDGTELLKNTKGKKNLTKGELGGGSFQSMGTPSQPLSGSYNFMTLFQGFSHGFYVP